MSLKQKITVLLTVFLPVCLIDRITKLWAQRYLSQTIKKDFLQGFLGWHYTRNTGIAFSMFSSSALPVIASFLIVAFVLTAIFRMKGLKIPSCAALCMIAAGGACNLFDRLLTGYVIDFIELQFVRFAIFNVADIFVCIGAVLLMIRILMGEEKKDEA